MGGVAGVGLSAVQGASGWSEVSSPTAKTLYEVVRTDNGPYAVGGSGTVIHRTSSGWEMPISDGPSGNNKTLLGAAVTDDGARLWMAGKSGVLGEYDVTTGTLTDWSQPNGTSNVFYDVEVTGSVDNERVHLTMGSGMTLYGKRQSNGEFAWETKDTGGSYTITAVDFHTKSDGRVVSDGGNVYETQSTSDGGWKWVEIGIEEAVNPLFDIVSEPNHAYIGGDNGQIWRGDYDCALWTPHSAGSKGVQALVRRNGVFLGAGDSGRVFEREGSFNRWVANETPVGAALLGCALGDPDIGVGKSGTIIER
ncbi:MAG: hypothetical protein ABEH90_06710 [Halolamina sp.]